MTGRYILSQFYKIAVYLYYSTLDNGCSATATLSAGFIWIYSVNNKLTFIN